jgi:hypothetical protein
VRPTVGVRGCRINGSGGKVEAVFGHFLTRSEAEQELARIEKVGFKNVAIENDGCGDYEVELDGVESAARTPFALEAKRAGYEVSFEQTAPPNAYRRGHVNAVFGTRATISAANLLERLVASHGFRYVDIAYMGPNEWRVTAPNIPVAVKRAFGAEAARVKLPVTFLLR